MNENRERAKCGQKATPIAVEASPAIAKIGLMKTFLALWLATLAAACSLCAQAPASAPATPAKAEPFLLLPEPKEMRTSQSATLGGARLTVFTPVRRPAGKAGLEPYTKAEFAKLGISPDSFAEKARLAADRLLATVQPELKKDAAGHVIYAVYRGDDPIYASLLAAPSIAKVFENIFGKEVWLAAPDRNALYVFPPNAAVVNDFAADLQDRFESNAFSASEEIFSLKADSGELHAVATFTNR